MNKDSFYFISKQELIDAAAWMRRAIGSRFTEEQLLAMSEDAQKQLTEELVKEWRERN